MKTVEKILKLICAAVGIFSGIVLLGMMVLTVVNVIARGVFNQAISGTNEILENFIIIAGFLGIGWTCFLDSHIKVDLLTDKLPVRGRRFCIRFNYVAAALISLLIAVENCNKAFSAEKMHLRTQLLKIPRYPFYYVIAFSYLLAALALIFLFISSFMKKDEEPEKMEISAEDEQVVMEEK